MRDKLGLLITGLVFMFPLTIFFLKFKNLIIGDVPFLFCIYLIDFMSQVFIFGLGLVIVLDSLGVLKFLHKNDGSPD